ncbi:MAG: endonuclease/exonuclease/phosphatase family protein [Akkermansiaceae bacterium]|nr:endonuclease/exonuclease/phosphatase family protein [Akkermansiaceae bacterium]
MLSRFLLISLTLWLGISSVSAIEIRVATYNVLTGIGNTGANGREELEAVIARINPDVLALQEVTGNDLNGPLNELAQSMGYPFVFAPVTALDTGSRVVILSKFPFHRDSSKSIISPPGANDMTRAAAAVSIDVPGTENDPTIVTAHLKCCFDQDDPFRRAVEMLRIRKYLEEQGLDKDDNIFVLGDFNLLGNNIVFDSLPSGLPQSYRLGNDIEFDVEYFADPTNYFTSLDLVNPGFRQQDGVTTDTYRGSNTVLDYILVSNSIARRTPDTEVYNSALDASNPGLPKEGNPLPRATSDKASDHYPVFGDFELDGGLRLDLTVAQPILGESSPASLVTVTLAEPATSTVQISLQSNDPSEGTITQKILIIPANGTQATTTLQPKNDKISDGDQIIEITASAAGFVGSVTSVKIRNTDPSFYSFSDPTTPILEDFEGFEGNQSLAAWSDEGLTWVGSDDGSSGLIGARSYQGALGILTPSEAVFQTTFRNDSEQSIPALKIEFEAQHWRRFTNGSEDRLQMSLLKDGKQIAIPELDFQPSITGQNGQLSPPETQSKSAYLRNLNLASGDEFELQINVIPGTPGNSESSDVFINEFHYDNSGSDVGEFIEVVVGPAFSNPLSSVVVHLYNGNNGKSYGSSISLTEFAAGPSNTPGLPALYSKEISGIQNGSPDGIALEVNGVVREFLSYEGTFTAIDGIAAGITSSSVGVTQGPNTPVDQQSIARTGTGGIVEDFEWVIQPGSHTPGEINVGQSFGASPKPQGIGIDNLIITPLKDQDGDQIPDQEELENGTNPALADSDQDGQDDYFETFLTGTNPLSGSSNFQPDLSVEQGIVQVTFPSFPGRFYEIETSIDLENWTSEPGLTGTGKDITFSFPQQDSQFFRISISLLE